MIDFLEVLDTSKNPIGIVDTAKSIIWHSVYFGVGDFEIYIEATNENLILLAIGNYVARSDTNDVGIIENIHVTFNLTEGYMLVASGRFLKSILDRRLIYNLSGFTNKPTVLSGLVEVAARSLVQNNVINCTFDSRRNIPDFALGKLKGFQAKIVDKSGNSARKQVSYQNLLEYSDKLLQEYGLAAKVTINDSNKNFLYTVYTGTNRSVDNLSGYQPIVLSTDYDNLNSSDYTKDQSTLKTSVLIGGEGEGTARKYSLVTGGQSGLRLRELFLDCSDISQTYQEDGSDEEKTYSGSEYQAMLNQQGQQALTENIVTEAFDGEVNVSFGTFQLNRDYYLGDIVTVQDNRINKYMNTRITETTEVQDDNGYSVTAVFGS